MRAAVYAPAMEALEWNTSCDDSRSAQATSLWFRLRDVRVSEVGPGVLQQIIVSRTLEEFAVDQEKWPPMIAPMAGRLQRFEASTIGEQAVEVLAQAGQLRALKLNYRHAVTTDGLRRITSHLPTGALCEVFGAKTFVV